MKVQLKTGLLRETPGWKMVLDQLGVPWERINDPASLSPDRFQSVIVNQPPDEREGTALTDYLNTGGAVLDCGHWLAGNESHLIARRYRKAIFPKKDDTLFADVWILDIYDRVLHHRNGRHLDGAALLEQRGNGFLAFLGFDFDRLMTDTRTSRKPFPSPGNLPNEVVSRVSKGELRRVVEKALKWLCHQRGLPWLRLSDCPDGEKNMFAFRIDSDYGTKEQVETMRRIADERNIRMTWFLHVEAHKDWLALFRFFEGHELGAHGFRHRLFPAARENRDNFRKAVTELKAAGIDAEAMAVPTGRWSYDIGNLLEENRFEYSSEFALDYDNVPFYPWMRNRPGSTLQVPIHPICIGNLIRAGQNTEDMKAYYRMAIEKKQSRGEPLIFYHHPPHAHWPVMEFILEESMKNGAENRTLGEYARWWKRRAETTVTADVEGVVLNIDLKGPSPEVFAKVERPDGRSILMKQSGKVDLTDNSGWTDEPKSVPIPEGLGALRSASFNLAKQSFLDFYWRMKQ